MSHEWHMERSTPVTESGCWIWLGCQDEKGYGMVTIGRKCHRAHRVSWEVEHGFAPGIANVLHKCDTPACINPAHLFLGTNADNVADKVAKGRQAKGASIGDSMSGERQGMHKLTEAQVVEIRGSTLKGVELSRLYGVSQSVISDIRNHKAWKRAGEKAA